MAKKSAKKVSKKSPAKKSHGELFDKHTNLIWLLPIFFIVAIIAVIALNNANSMQKDVSYENEAVVEENMDLPDTEELMVEDDL